MRLKLKNENDPQYLKRRPQFVLFEMCVSL